MDISKKITSRDIMQTKVIINNNIACIEIKHKDGYKNIQGMTWNIKIVHDSKTVMETGFNNIYNLSYHLEDDGMYLLFYQVKINGGLYYHARDSFWYYSKEAKNKFIDFYIDYNEFDDDYPELSTLKYPYQNLALIMLNKNNNERINNINLKNISLEEKLYDLSSSENYYYYVLSTNPPIKTEKYTLFFSGKSKQGKNFIYGYNDIKQADDIDILLDGIGYWSAIYKNEEMIKITNDYFGMYPLYIYENIELKIVCNSFHLLLLILNEFGIKQELDINTIIPYFSMGQRMLFAQLASENTFIKGIKKISIDKGIQIRNEKLEVYNKPIYEVLNEHSEFSFDEYEILKKKAEEEIIENIEVVLEDKRFKNVLCDVTGGKDSRTVLAALLNCNKNFFNKILINSKNTQGTKDYSVFIPLNHLHEFPYNTLPEKVKKISLLEKDLRNRSITMGVSFSRPLPWVYEYEGDSKSRARLIGAGGEALMRPAYSMFYPYADYTSKDSLVTDILLGCNNGILDFNKEIINKTMHDIVETGLSEVGGQDTYERLNNYYLYFRNVYHFGLQSMIDSMEGPDELWSPLFSKSAMRAWHMVCSKFCGLQFQIDLMNDMEPMLLSVPFESIQDNREMEKLQKNGSIKKDINCNIDLNYDDKKWKEANEKIFKNRVVLNQEELIKIDQKNEVMYKNYYNILLKRLNKILHYDKRFKENLGLELYTFITKAQNEQIKGLKTGDLVYLYNKITSLSDIINIINYKDKEYSKGKTKREGIFNAKQILQTKDIVVYAKCSEDYLKGTLPVLEKIKKISYIIPNELKNSDIIKDIEVISKDELIKMKDIVVIIAQAGEEHIRNTVRILHEISVPYDHISNYGNSISLTVLKSLGYNEYFDYLGNYIKYNSAKGTILIKKDNLRSRNNEVIFKDISTTKGITITLFGEEGQVHFGNSTCYQGAFLISTKGRIDVGDDCMFSHDVFISQPDQHLIFDLQSKKRININKNIVIGNHVWIGRSVHILGGCQIPDNCIVGAYTVTSGKFYEKNCIIAGNPGKIIRKGIIWTRDSQSLNYMTFEECTDQDALKYIE